MTITTSELKLYKSAVVNDTTANGGRASTSAVVSGAAQNVFPHVFKADRVSGLLRYRKVIYRNENDADETGYGAQPFFHHPPSGDHYLWYHIGSHDDTQADIIGSERRYGSAVLATDAAAGQKIVVLSLKHVDQAALFVDGDAVKLSNLSTPTSATGTEEDNVINGTPALSGLQLTVTLTNNLANAYAAATSSLTSGPAGVDMECAVSGWTEAWSGDGAYDESTYPLTMDNIGTVYDTWALTYSTATSTWTCVGANEGTVGTWDGAADFAPINGSKSNKPFFTLAAAGLSGTPADGDTLVFTTSPAAINVWETLTVPAGADPVGSGGFYSYLDVETA